MRQRFCDGVSRRDMLRVGLLGLTGMSLADHLALADDAQPSSGKPRQTLADSVIFVNLAGGPAHLDTLDMKEGLSSETKSEFSSIGSKIAGLQVCEHLPRIAGIMDQVTLLRGISHTAGDHPQGQAYLSSGNRPNAALAYPSYGSVIMKELPYEQDLPPYVAIPDTEWKAGYLGDAFNPFKTNATPEPGKPFSVRGLTFAPGVSLETVERRVKLLDDLDRRFATRASHSQLLEALGVFGRQAHEMITSKRTRAAFDVDSEPESIRELFAKDPLGQGLLLATRLIESGVRFITVTNSGWDTHLDNFSGHKRLLPPLDNAVPALLEALRAKGLLERTLVIVMGEFGRTPKINQNRGRDHFPRANWSMLAGGGVMPGQLIGGTDKNGAAPDDGTDLHPDDIGASIFHALGIDHLKEYHTRTGRPVSLVPKGRVIDGLFSG
jgi:hypothetical protein